MLRLVRSGVSFCALALAAVPLGCSSSGGSNSEASGSVGEGGALGSGGTTAAGGSAAGGDFPMNGGAPASGGAPSGDSSSGGASAGDSAITSGGKAAPNGGANANGGGKASSSGGKASSSGGKASSSGGSESGGKASSGGSTATGGTGGSGGAGGSSDIVVPAGYKLVWHDEFDVDGAPNPANWKFEKGFVRNEEDQWYQSDNASVKGGLLVIEGRKERVTNPNYTGSGDWKTSRQYAEYTSSSMLTSGLQSFQYGRFEMRGRIPTAAGMWPAWWTLGVSGEWPSNGEIDIMEYYNNKVLANVACGTATRWQAKWNSQTKSLSSLGSGWSSQFHVWRMDWDDQKIVLYLDDQQMNSVTLSSMLNSDGTSPFKQKDYMLLNLAIGGNNGGNPDNTQFPQRFEVDYVRVFQKQ